MAEIASAFVSLMPSAQGFGRKLDSEISGDIDKSGKSAGSKWGKVFAIGAALAVGAKALNFLGDSLGEAREANVIGARTANVIKSMGNAANISAGGVANLAGAISAKSGIDDEAIQSGQNLLLTFGKIRNEAGKGNDIFNQTSQLMVDMSAAMGTDAKSAALQLGKALNNPTKGVTALTRAGVSFTTQQTEQIKKLQESGDMLGAQKIILGEVEKQFGGAAESMATPADKAKVAIGNLKETIGTALLPAVDSATTKFTEFVTEMQTGEGAGGKVADVLKTITGNLDTIAPVLATVAGGMLAYKAASLAAAAASWIQAAGTTAATGATWSLNAALLANPIGLVIVLITALVAGLIIAYKKSDTFRKIVDGAWKAVKIGAAAMWAGIKVVFDKLKEGFDALGRAGAWLWNNALQPAFKFIVGGVASILDLWSTMLSNLAEVPGFGWAKTAAEAMGNAADKARNMADNIKKIPTSKKVTITTVYMTRNAGKERSMGDDFLPRVAGLPGKGAADAIMSSYGDRAMQLFARGIEKGGKKARAALESQLDKLKGTLSTLRDDFASLAESVSSAFTGDLFEAATAGDFVAGLTAKKGELTSLLASFKTLAGWGVAPSFLSQLFASGNGALITELAGMGQAGAVSTASLFGEVQSLGSQLGNAVATSDYGPDIRETTAEIKELRKDIAKLPDKNAKAMNNIRLVIEGGNSGQRAYLRTGRG